MKTLFARTALAGLLLGATFLVQAADASHTPSPAGAEVYIISPKDGDTVTGSGEFMSGW